MTLMFPVDITLIQRGRVRRLRKDWGQEERERGKELRRTRGEGCFVVRKPSVPIAI